MYKENVKIITRELGKDITEIVNCETQAVYYTQGNNYYYDCSKCKNQSIGDDSGTQYDCNNCGEFEAKELTKSGKSKLYCKNYAREQ